MADTYTAPSGAPDLTWVYRKSDDVPVGIAAPSGKEVLFGGADLTAVNGVVGARYQDGLPDPRKSAGVSAQIVFPGSTSQHVATGIGGRIVVAGSGATNTSAAISVVSASGRKTDAIQGATDAVNLRFADLDKARQPLLVTTGSSAAAIVIEAL